MPGRKKLSKLSYVVKATKVLSEWETDDLSEAYKQAVYLSRLEDLVTVEEVSKRMILRFRNGEVVK